MTKLVTSVTDVLGLTDSKAGDRAARASENAAQTQVGYQQDALDYLKAQNEPYNQARIASLGRLGELSLSPNITGLSSEQLLSKAQGSPLYNALLGGRDAGERSILRNAAATGGLRGGGTQSELSDFNTNLANQALLGALGFEQQQEANRIGLAENNLNRQFAQRLGIEQTIQGLPNYAGQIASGIGGIGQTLAQGQVGAAQTRLQGSQANTANLLNILGTAAAFSDRRLKDDIKLAGTENGYNVYTWRWNSEAEKLGLEGVGRGVIADEVNKVKPEAVKAYMGFDTVDYEMIGVKHG